MEYVLVDRLGYYYSGWDLENDLPNFTKNVKDAKIFYDYDFAQNFLYGSKELRVSFRVVEIHEI